MMEQELTKFLTFWDHLNENEKELLKQNATFQTYAKGITMHRGSDDCLGVVLVRKGQLRTYMLSPDGRDITLYRLFAGDVCILSASCVLETITFDVFIDIEENSEIITITATLFQQLAKQNIYVETFGYKMATNRFSDVMWLIDQIMWKSFDKRLAAFLLEESALEDSRVLKITHEKIANHMGTAREVVTRMLRYFQNEGMVQLSRGTIEITDSGRLEELHNA